MGERCSHGRILCCWSHSHPYHGFGVIINNMSKACIAYCVIIGDIVQCMCPDFTKMSFQALGKKGKWVNCKHLGYIFGFLTRILCMNFEQFQLPIWRTLDRKTTQMWSLANKEYIYLKLWLLYCCLCCCHSMFLFPQLHIPNYFWTSRLSKYIETSFFYARWITTTTNTFTLQCIPTTRSCGFLS